MEEDKEDDDLFAFDMPELLSKRNISGLQKYNQQRQISKNSMFYEEPVNNPELLNNLIE